MTWQRARTLVLAPAFLASAFLIAVPSQAQDGGAGAASRSAGAGAAFDVEFEAPKDVQELLRRHLDLMRYRELTDLDRAELERLLVAARLDVRQLLATLGYFSPLVEVRLEDPSDAGNAPRKIRVTVQPGAPTQVSEVTIEFSGAIANDPTATQQRESIRTSWPLRAGLPFTQARWDAAKLQSLRLIGARRYAAARIASSRADVDPQDATARLSLTLDSGPGYRLGPMQIKGLERYDEDLVQRLALLNPGEPYDQAALLEAQQRLQDSGYFDSVYLSLDTSGDPEAAPVLAQLREAQRNKLVLGLGYSTDGGLRVSVEHTNLKLPGIGWKSVSNLLLDSNTQSLSAVLLAPPDAGRWRWLTSAVLKKDNSAASVDVDSVSLRAGRTQLGVRVDHTYDLQYDRANTIDQGRTRFGESVSANYATTLRSFDSLVFPSSGYGVSAEFGGGWTLSGVRQPFLRAQLRWLGIFPLAGQAQAPLARSGRIALRAQGGAVVAGDSADIPGNQLFLTGGEATVRGYAYNSIGTLQPNGTVTPGRYLALGSVEWQNPILLDGQPSDWESAVFADAGAVADKPSALKAQFGVGAGVRWRSPVGPLQLDLAYGVEARQWRTYLSVGFTF